MQQDFDAHHAMHKAGHGHTDAKTPHGARWAPLVAAALAVLAALATLVANQRSTMALIQKNEAILSQAQATDTWNYFEAKSIKQHVYTATALIATGPSAAKLLKVAEREKREKDAVQRKAAAFEEDVKAANERSEVAMKSHELLEIAIAMFEIAIVLASISALVTTRLLTIVGGTATAVGLVFLFLGLRP